MVKKVARRSNNRWARAAASGLSLAKSFANGIGAKRKFINSMKQRSSKRRKRTVKKESLTEVASNRVGTGIIQQNFAWGRRISKLQKRLNSKSSPFIRLNNQPTYILSSTGAQGAQLLSSIYTPYDISLYNGGPGDYVAHPTTSKMFLGHCKWITRGTNVTPQNVQLEIYHIVNRRDNFGSSAEAQDPMTAWNQGLLNVGGNPLVASTQIGATPFASRAFCAFYRVIKKTVYQLSAGESFIHKCYIKANRTFNMEQINANSTSSYNTQNIGGFRNLTHWQLIVLNPYPGNEETDTTNVPGNVVSEYAGRVDLIVSKDYISWQTQANTTQPNLYYTSTVATNITAGKHGAVLNFQSGEKSVADAYA